MAGGIGLKPIVVMSHACPVPDCKYEFRYHYRDRRTHPDTWVMTASSLEHLATGHATAKPKLYIVRNEELPVAA
jgi:hypothetical protein